MATVVWDGSIAWDASSGTAIIAFTTGVDVAWEEAVAAADIVIFRRRIEEE